MVLIDTVWFTCVNVTALVLTLTSLQLTILYCILKIENKYIINIIFSLCVQAELDKLRFQHDANMKQVKVEFQQKMEQVTADLDLKWQDTLRLVVLSLSSFIYR